MPFKNFQTWRSSKEKWSIRNSQLEKAFHRKLDEINECLVAGNIDALDAVGDKVANANRVLTEWEEHVSRRPKLSRGTRRNSKRLRNKRNSLEVVAATSSQLTNLLNVSNLDSTLD